MPAPDSSRAAFESASASEPAPVRLLACSRCRATRPPAAATSARKGASARPARTWTDSAERSDRPGSRSGEPASQAAASRPSGAIAAAAARRRRRTAGRSRPAVRAGPGGRRARGGPGRSARCRADPRPAPPAAPAGGSSRCCESHRQRSSRGSAARPPRPAGSGSRSAARTPRGCPAASSDRDSSTWPLRTAARPPSARPTSREADRGFGGMVAGAAARDRQHEHARRQRRQSATGAGRTVSGGHALTLQPAGTAPDRLWRRRASVPWRACAPS